MLCHRRAFFAPYRYIHAQESREAADRKSRAIINDDLCATRMNTAEDLVERSVHETSR
jgi:hypothetical protein